jgi:acetoacetate decarboxylase
MPLSQPAYPRGPYRFVESKRGVLLVHACTSRTRQFQ